MHIAYWMMSTLCTSYVMMMIMMMMNIEQANRCQCLIAVESEIQPHFMRYLIGMFDRQIFCAAPMHRKAFASNEGWWICIVQFHFFLNRIEWLFDYDTCADNKTIYNVLLLMMVFWVRGDCYSILCRRFACIGQIVKTGFAVTFIHPMHRHFIG